jgi:hypothetical protein
MLVRLLRRPHDLAAVRTLHAPIRVKPRFFFAVRTAAAIASSPVNTRARFLSPFAQWQGST